MPRRRGAHRKEFARSRFPGSNRPSEVDFFGSEPATANSLARSCRNERRKPKFVRDLLRSVDEKARCWARSRVLFARTTRNERPTRLFVRESAGSEARRRGNVARSCVRVPRVSTSVAPKRGFEPDKRENDGERRDSFARYSGFFARSSGNEADRRRSLVDRRRFERPSRRFVIDKPGPVGDKRAPRRPVLWIRASHAEFLPSILCDRATFARLFCSNAGLSSPLSRLSRSLPLLRSTRTQLRRSFLCLRATIHRLSRPIRSRSISIRTGSSFVTRGTSLVPRRPADESIALADESATLAHVPVGTSLAHPEWSLDPFLVAYASWLVCEEPARTPLAPVLVVLESLLVDVVTAALAVDRAGTSDPPRKSRLEDVASPLVLFRRTARPEHA